MDTFSAFSAFSTSPSGAGVSGGGGNSGSGMAGQLNASVGDAKTHRGSTPQQQQLSQQQQQQQRRPSSNVNSPQMVPSANLFSTSAAPMPNHNSDFNPNLAAQFGTFRLSASLEVPAAMAGSGLDDKALESITQTLSALQSIAEGRHLVVWPDLLDPSDPQGSAQRVSDTLTATPLTCRKDALKSVAAAITTPRHLAIVGHLEEPYRNDVRDLVLQELLGQLPMTGSEPMPICADMLAELARLNLVRMSGVAVAIDQFLSQPEKRRAGIALLGRMAEYNSGDEGFLRAIKSTMNVEPMLRELYKDPNYEYDVVSITRMLGGDGSAAQPSHPPNNPKAGSGETVATTTAGAATGANTAVGKRASSALQRHGVLSLGLGEPATALHYLRARDELVSAHGSGTYVLWDTPKPPTGEVKPVLGRELPHCCVPVDITGPASCQYLAVAGVPTHVGSPYHKFMEAAGQNVSQVMLANAERPPESVIHFFKFDEYADHWNVAETATRPFGTMITAIAAPGSSAVCSAETCVAGGGVSGGLVHPGAHRVHNLEIFDVNSGESLQSIANAHSDYITVLTACDDSEAILVSGSRDRTVKVWDTRCNANNANSSSGNSNASNVNGSGGSPFFTLNTGGAIAAMPHADTISSLYTFRNYIFTGSLDGTLCVWDSRRFGSPAATRSFAAGVLSITALEGSRAAVATARGLYLLSLETMGALDILPNTVFTRLACNDNGQLLFAAGIDGVSLFSVQR